MKIVHFCNQKFALPIEIEGGIILWSKEFNIFFEGFFLFERPPCKLIKEDVHSVLLMT